MIQISKKKALSFVLVIIALLNIFAMSVLASEAETAPLETVTIVLLSDEGEVIASFSSQEEFEVYMSSGVSPMYVTCGTGLYWHGQFTYTVEYDIVKTSDDGNGNITILYLTYVEVRCSSCDGLIKYYYK